MDFYRSPVLVVSNVFWFIPAGVAYAHGSIWLVLPALAVMSLSMWFHFSPTKNAEIVDTIFSMFYILLGPVLCSLSPNPVQAWLGAVMATGVAGLVWFVAHSADRKQNKRGYVRWHTIWHLAAANVTVVIYINYFGLL
jgi:hypothetical protein